MLNGKKTYISAGAAIITAIAGVLTGELEIVPAILTVLGALGLGSARSAIAKKD